MAVVVAVAALAVPIGSTLAASSLGSAPAAAVAPAASRGLSPFSDGMAASIVLGQTSFTTDNGGVTPTNFSDPQSVAIDAAGDLWISDQTSHRVVEFRAPVYTGEPASVVLGQPNFYTSTETLSATGMSIPIGVAFSPSGDLWVADWGYCRVTEFVPPFTTGMAASVVLGQASFTTDACGHTASTFAEPNGLAIDPSGDIFVAEQENNRVTEFVPPFSDGMSASAVLGQSSFTGDVAGTSAVNLSCPLGVAASASMVWVGDSPCGNSRVMGFPQPVSTGEAATAILGQASFTSTGATGDNITDNPNSLAVDPAGDLYVVDNVLNRIAIFTPPFTPFKTPTAVVGQATLAGTGYGLTATTLDSPRGVAIAPDGTMWVVDEGNTRVLGYVPTQFTLAFEESGLPAASPWAVSVDGTSHLGSTSSLNVDVENGTHDWTIGPAPPGYHVTSAGSGATTVNGSASTVSVSFAQNGTSSGSLLEGLVIGIVVGVIVGVAAGILISRKRKAAPASASAWSAPAGSPPAGGAPSTPPASGGGPPPGASS